MATMSAFVAGRFERGPYSAPKRQARFVSINTFMRHMRQKWVDRIFALVSVEIVIFLRGGPPTCNRLLVEGTHFPPRYWGTSRPISIKHLEALGRELVMSRKLGACAHHSSRFVHQGLGRQSYS